MIEAFCYFINIPIFTRCNGGSDSVHIKDPRVDLLTYEKQWLEID